MEENLKQILLKDICSRLPYKIKGVLSYDKDKEIFTIEGCEIEKGILYLSNSEGCHVDDFKPFLRTMSSMTEGEKDYIKNVARFKQSDGIHYDDGVHYVPIYQETLDDQWKTDGKFPPILGDIYRFMLEYGYILLIDFFNSHHLDYQGLIPRGLAIEAPKDMYGTKTE